LSLSAGLPDGGTSMQRHPTVARSPRYDPASTLSMGSRPLGVREPVDVPGLPTFGGRGLSNREPSSGRGYARIRDACKVPVMSRRLQERLHGPSAAYDHPVPRSAPLSTEHRNRIPLSGALVTGRFTPILADARSPLLRAFRASGSRNRVGHHVTGHQTTEAPLECLGRGMSWGAAPRWSSSAGQISPGVGPASSSDCCRIDRAA
jgi:hypothetical protein